MRSISWLGCFSILVATSLACSSSSPTSNGGGSGGNTGSGGTSQSGGSSGSGGSAGSGGSTTASGGTGGSSAAGGTGGQSAGTGGTPATGGSSGSGGSPAPADAGGDTGGETNTPAAAGGPFTCTEMMGLLTSGEWYNAGFEMTLGTELAAKWQGRFAHYGYVQEYSKPDSYVWSPTNQGGVNNVNLVSACTQNPMAPDRVVYQAWSWELTTEEAWMTNLEAAVATIKAKRPSAKRIELMTIVRCPMNGWCHDDKPPLGPGTDRNAGKQDCNVPAYVDSAFAKVAAKSGGLVTVAPKFEAHACAPNIDGIHLGPENRAVATDIANHYKTMP